MQDYDATLKQLLRKTSSRAIALLAEAHIDQWLDVALPKVQNLRMDLLGEDAEGNLYHFELQSGNDPGIDLRMAEYALGVRRLMGRFPRQMVLYIGQAPLTMPSELQGPHLSIRYRVVDIRELSGDELLASSEVGDNVVAVLARLRDRQEAVREIVAKIGELPESERQTAIRQLLILAGLRGMEELVQEEVEKLPIEIDIMQNEVLGPAIRQGLEQGRTEGRTEGLREGLQEGRAEEALRILRRHIRKRFGSLPEWADTKLGGMSIDEMEAVIDRIFDASSITDLLM